MASEPPLTDRELRVVRGMIDSYESERLVDAWWASRFRVAKYAVGLASAGAVLTASVIEIVRTVG